MRLPNLSVVNDAMGLRLAKFDLANLRLRVLSAAVLIPLVLGIVYVGGWIYGLSVMIVMALGLWEWWQITKRVFGKKTLGLIYRLLLGTAYLGSAGVALMYIRWVDQGMALTVYLLITVWATDIGAYVSGRMIGGPKLLPKISPKKTWAGLYGGMVFAALFGYAVAHGFGASHSLAAMGLSVVLAVVSQLGDLLESYVKRRSGVKDSGNLIPGHGGLLDRIDGLLLGSIFFALFQIMVGHESQWW